jgi:hypothetical protein
MGFMTAVETATPITKSARRAALACVSGQIVFTVGWLLAGLLQGDSYSIARHDISDTGAVGAPHACVLLVTQGIAGACTLAFVLVAFRHHGCGRDSVVTRRSRMICPRREDRVWFVSRLNRTTSPTPRWVSAGGS